MTNDLTRRLFPDGWKFDDEEHPPLPAGTAPMDYESIGWKWEVKLTMNWVTGCGLCVDPRRAATCDMYYNGIRWCVENENPVYRCPYDRRDCEHNLPGLKFPWCVLSRTDAPYDHERSAEKVEAEASRRSREQYMEITGGQFCACVEHGNGFDGGRCQVRYDVERCIRLQCKNKVCSITKRERDLSKVNVFYDIRRTWITRAGLFEDTRTEITKGMKVFEHPVARTDAEIWLARRKAEFDPFKDKNIIDPHLSREDQQQEFFSKMHRKYPGYDYFEYHYSVENIRIEHREFRDIKQDLEDVRAGIEVTHAIDIQKAETAKKRENREKNKQRKKAKMEKQSALSANGNVPNLEQMSLFL